jgi:hypothetical protein
MTGNGELQDLELPSNVFVGWRSALRPSQTVELAFQLATWL